MAYRPKILATTEGGTGLAAAGTSGNVLTSNGTNWTSAAASGSGDWVMISSQTASSSATINFTSLSSTYSTYVVLITNLGPATDQASFYMRTSANNGSTYDSGASDYKWFVKTTNMGSSVETLQDGSTGKGYIQLTSTQSGTNSFGNLSTEKGSLWIKIFNPSAVKYCRIMCEGSYTSNTPEEVLVISNGVRVASADVDAIRFLFSTGNIATGTFTLYGIVA